MTGRTLPTTANAIRRALPKGSNELDPIKYLHRRSVGKLEKLWVSLGRSLRQSASARPDRRRPTSGEIPRVSTTRLEAFSDGVIAVAITLLVLNIDVPDLNLRVPDRQRRRQGLGPAPPGAEHPAPVLPGDQRQTPLVEPADAPQHLQQPGRAGGVSERRAGSSCRRSRTPARRAPRRSGRPRSERAGRSARSACPGHRRNRAAGTSTRTRSRPVRRTLRSRRADDR